MHKAIVSILVVVVSGAVARAQPRSELQLTVYNGGFAAVKEVRTLELGRGENEVRVTGMTSQLEADSVVLRDLRRPDVIRILEQNYVANPLSQEHLLRASEGRTIDFEVLEGPGSPRRIVSGKVIRAGGGPYYPYDAPHGAPEGEPIVEVDGKIRFGLPGVPLFPGIDQKAMLKPTLLWRLHSAVDGRREAELSYLTGGLRWHATYNVVAAEAGESYDLVAWITLANESGKDFDNAQVKLIAGEVHRARREQEDRRRGMGVVEMQMAAPAQVEQRAFDEYHLYSLPRSTTVRDREVKQVEFLRAAEIPGRRVYLFDVERPLTVPLQYSPDGEGGDLRPVDVVLEIQNSEKNGLGVPLPGGTMKIYRRDRDGRSEFVGEDALRHTPRNETVRLKVGQAFDVVGERRQTDVRGVAKRQVEESFEIKLRNHKKAAVEVRVVEHLRRTRDWSIRQSSHEYAKKDASTIEFRVPVKPDGETVLTYTVLYRE